MNRVILVITLCFIRLIGHTPALKAEGLYRPGCIITLSNDTVKGYLQYRQINAYTKCRFKKTEKDKYIEYKPEEIQGYLFEGERKFFISKNTPLENGEKKLFLQYLIKGKANIYFMSDDMEHYYIETEKTGLLELSQRPQLTTRDDGYTVYKTELYVGKLKIALDDCPEIYDLIDKSALNPKSLINVAKEYHNKVCNTEQCIIFERQVKPAKVIFTPMAGITFNKFKFGKSYTDYSFSQVIGCKISLENSILSREYIAIQTGMFLQRYGSYSIHHFNTGYSTMPAGTIFNSSINTLAIKVPIIFTYTLTNTKLKPFIGGGVINILTFSDNRDFTVRVNNYYKADKFSLYQLGLSALSGIKYSINPHHDLVLDINYEYTVGTQTEDGTNALKNNNFSVLMGYTF